MAEENDNVTHFPKRTPAAVMRLEMPDLPEGPFTVTVTDSTGKKMWEVHLDKNGDCPPETMVMATGGPFMPQLVVNLLTGALRAFAGFVH